MFSRGSVTLLRVRDVPIRVHWTLLIVLPYLAYVFATDLGAIGRAAGVAPDRLSMPPLLWGLLATVGLFASVTLHELAHTLVASRSGGHVRAVTLMMLGGVSELDRPPTRPRDEALMAAAGPATSLALAALLYGLERVSTGADLRVALFYLARLNLVLGLFNLLPAFPMDGGRVLRGLLAGRLGLAHATRIAARVGKVTAVGLFLLGLFGGNFMLVLIALFVHTGADLEAQSVELRARLAGLRLADIMAAPPPAIVVTATCADALERMHRLVRTDLVLADEQGVALGIVTAADLARVDPDTPLSALRDVVGDRFVIAPADAPATDALAGQTSPRFFLVSDDGNRIVGLVGPREIENAVALRSARPPRRRPILRPVVP